MVNKNFIGVILLKELKLNKMNYTKEQIRVGAEKAFILDLIVNKFPKGIVSYVADSFNLWDVITKILPTIKSEILARDGKLTIRPDSGDPVDIICGYEILTQKQAEEFVYSDDYHYNTKGKCIEKNGKLYPIYVSTYPDGCINEIYADTAEKPISEAEQKGVIELLWDIFGGTINEQGYKVLDPHIGAIYGDSITPERQVQIYERLAAKGFAATNIVLGVGSFTYQYNTRDTLGFACKGSWFEIRQEVPASGYDDITKSYNIYKDPITDDGTKKSLKGLLSVIERYTENPGGKTKLEYFVMQECTPEEEDRGLLQVIYEDGKFYNQTTLTEIREKLNELS